MKRYKSTTILGGGPPGKIVQCQSFNPNPFISNIFILEDPEKYYIILRIRNETVKAE